MTAAERDLFRLLVNTVSGIGPKIALNILSGMNPVAFRGAVASGDVKSLSQISGVGRKTAERIVVELRDKIGAAGAWEAASARHALSPEDQKINDAVLALMALGFKQVEAHDAVRAAANDARRKGNRGGTRARVPEKRSVMDAEPSAATRAGRPPPPPKIRRDCAQFPEMASTARRPGSFGRRCDCWRPPCVIASTIRTGSPREKDHGQVIYCIWHNRLALCMKLYFTFGRRTPLGPGWPLS